jgi:beta-lactamase class D
MKYFLLIAIAIFSLSFVKCSEEDNDFRNDLMSVIDSSGYDGCFVMRDLSSGKTSFVNYKRCSQKFSPASTFKIPNSLIALESGAVSSIHDTIRYNGIEKPIESWNRDHDLESAYKNSVVWYYQDIANRIGDSTMKYWLDTLKDYGTMNRAGNINSFWLDGSLEISALEQVNFLEKLYKGTLPFKKSTMDTVKKIMLFEDNPKYKIFAKTGYSDKSKIGWFVGWVEKGEKAYIFATNISESDTLNTKFLGSRITITKKMLNALRVMN